MRALDLWPALALACLAPASGAASLDAQEVIPTAAPMLSPGDMVRITVWRQPELSGDFPILGTGTIGHPLYKDVRVVGVPIEDAERSLLAVLSQLEANPQVVFEPLLRVAVSGEVRMPAFYHVPPETTVAEAVARAGGPSDRGKTDDVRLFRGGGESRLDLHDRASVRIPVRSGDEIYVRAKSSFNFLQHVFVPLTSAGALVFSIVRVAR